MSDLHVKFNFKLSTLALSVGLSLMSSGVFALEALDDHELGAASGEGIAMLPEDFAMQFNGADNTTGAGYIRLIPVGPLTQTAQDTNKDEKLTSADHSVGKADIYLYGLAISQSNQNYGAGRVSADTNSRFGRPIGSWGTAANPWLLKVATQTDVPNFSASSKTDTGKGDVSYINIEAPLYTMSTITSLTAAEQSAYNLKLGFWVDAMVRDQTKTESSSDTFNLGEAYNTTAANRANRLRLQAVWDGLSVNGSNIKIFQTLDGVKAGEVTQGLSTTYNNTFGMSGLLRFNSGDGGALRASYSNAAGTAYITSGSNATRTEGAWDEATSIAAGFGCGDTGNFGVAKCEYRFRSRTVTDKLGQASTWKAPSTASVLRLSSREAAGAVDTNKTRTPAIDGSSYMPSFDANEGLYLYNPNINLVLGSLYQPLTFGTDGKNITMEIARIPNKEAIYKQIYTDYYGGDTSYKGSTCNIYKCGTSTVAGYQGSNATHSSITIGSTDYDSATNTITAHKGLGSVGVSFGKLQDRTVAAGVGTKNYTQWQDQQRQMRTRTFNWTDTYEVYDQDRSNVDRKTDPYTGIVGNCDSWGIYSCNRTIVNNGGTNQIKDDYACGIAGLSTCTRYLPAIKTDKGYHIDWIYRTAGNADSGTFGSTDGAYTDAQIAVCTGNGKSGTASCDASTSERDSTGIAAPADALNWDLAGRGLNWADSTAVSAGIRGVILDNIPTAAIINTSATNNFGSAVIDGLLIQHMKFTTKGL